MVAGFFSEFAYWFLLFIILLNISQRKIAHSDGKRKATILIAVVMLVLQVLLAMRMQLKLPEWVDWCSVALCLLVIIIFHRTFWPFRLRCAKCGKRLDFNHIIGCDENLCEDCFCEMYPEYAEEKRRKAMTAEQRLEETFTKAGKVSDIPWDEWEATEKCVLTYVIDGSRVLMIEKKTGLGAGYINAPGGHIEIEETKAKYDALLSERRSDRMQKEADRVSDRRRQDDPRPGVRLTIQGFDIIIGRNAKENDEILRRYTRGSDIWLHTRDYAGGYVIIKAKKGKSVPLPVLLDAASLAIHYSKAKKSGRADLYYTEVKYLRRAKDGKTGLVIPTQERNLSATLDEKRVKEMLG